MRKKILLVMLMLGGCGKAEMLAKEPVNKSFFTSISQNVQEKLKRLGKRINKMTNSVDLKKWSLAAISLTQAYCAYYCAIDGYIALKKLKNSDKLSDATEHKKALLFDAIAIPTCAYLAYLLKPESGIKPPITKGK